MDCYVYKISGNPPYPSNQGGWTRWRIWQFSEDFKIEGVGNPVDANWGPNNIDLLMQPDIVSGFRVRTEGNKIILNWNRNKNIDLLGYKFFLQIIIG